MASKLFLGNDEYITVDRIFCDGGTPAQYGMSGGTKILLSSGQRACPTIYQVGKGFFFQDGRQPVTDLELIERHPGLPEPYRHQALAFARSQQTAEVKPLKPTKVKAKARGRKPALSTPPRRGGVVIDSEEALSEAAGGVTA